MVSSAGDEVLRAVARADSSFASLNERLKQTLTEVTLMFTSPRLLKPINIKHKFFESTFEEAVFETLSAFGWQVAFAPAFQTSKIPV
jgi:hypothetical protein